jgi:hypothetical protein
LGGLDRFAETRVSQKPGFLCLTKYHELRK